ncbi:hypothetical protein EJ02DRAFT_432518 [Clathrospora elynae]|uniref:Zn(2)-C6 fungal-type domain-containing protein n=1 Tax=Clathrospora elynae TaxID=706981 RepID=A0A6A5SU59_9PLEO|nr:hypothetical protein EJ02DRAFT_432518 [Clathrospora elynae]
MRERHSRDTSCEVVRSQPQPSMPTSSQYRSAAQSHSHYQDFPTSNHDHLYGLAATWQDPNHDSYAAGPSPAPFLHYTQAGVDSASLHQLHIPPAWSSGYVRQEPHDEWHHAGPEQSFASRSAAPYADAERSAPVSHQNPAVSRHYQHQQALEPGHALPLSPQEDAFRGTERFNALRLSSDSPANTVDPPFSNHAQRLPPVSQLAHPHTQTVPLHADNGSHVPLHSAVAWDSHQQYPRHTGESLPGRVTATRHNSSSTASWPVVDPGETPAVPVVYERVQNNAQDWAVADAQHEHEPYAQHQVPVDPFKRTSAQILVHQRPPPKKKTAKVPSSFVERQEKLKVSKRKGPLQERQREKTHTMRKTKRICVRCRFYKSGCDEGDPCEKCEKITGHARSFREPCYREHLEDTSLIRRCNGREHQEEAEFLGYEWIHNSQLYEMEILWNLPGYGPIPNASPLRITFRPYSPTRGPLDVAASVWSNKEGQVPSVEQPAYAIYDTENLVPAFERYFSSLQPAIEDWIFSRIRQDDVAFQTYQEVVRMRGVNGSKALDLAMRLQCLSVVSQGYGSVFSNNIPGIREYDYRRLGRSDYEAYDRGSCDRPLPGAITHQMDVAAVKYLRKLEKLFVKELATLIFKPRIKPWYELFLAFYVIFWNLEYIHHGAQDYIKSKNGTLFENQVSNVVTTQIKKWEFAFPVLLYHWRCILRGYSPFKLARDNPDELRDKGHIDPEGFQYVTRIANLFDRVNPDRFQPPLTGFAATHWSTSSEWIVKLFKEAGA